MRNASKSGLSSADSNGLRVTSGLTGTERKILDFMVLYLRRNTYQPSIREIGERFGIKSTKTVSEHLQALEDKGFLERDPSRSRGVKIIGIDLSPQIVSVPYYRDLGEAATGFRSNQAVLHISMDRRLVSGQGCFMVRSPRNRLASVGIYEGDALVIEPVLAEELKDGEIIVAGVGAAPDYYRLRKASSRVFLHPVDGGEAPVREREPTSLVLMGRVAAIYRRFENGPLSSATAH